MPVGSAVSYKYPTSLTGMSRSSASRTIDSSIRRLSNEVEFKKGSVKGIHALERGENEDRFFAVISPLT